MGAKDLAEKNLLQYKDVFSDIVNVNLFGGRCYVSAEELSREPGELQPPAQLNIINLRLDITHLYYPAKNSFQKGRLKRREIFTELLLYTLTT